MPKLSSIIGRVYLKGEIVLTAETLNEKEERRKGKEETRKKKEEIRKKKDE